MPIKLTENSERIASVCRKAAAACASLATSHEWPVVLLEHFRSLPESNAAGSYATTPAAYRRSDATLYVNGETFFAMSEDEQLAVIMHEVGHAVEPEGDCFDADMFACRHGQETTLVTERAKHYGGAAGSSPYLCVIGTPSEAPRLLHAALATTTSFGSSKDMSR
jgi:hypothetical protein